VLDHEWINDPALDRGDLHLDAEIHCLRGPAPATIQRRLDRRQPDPLVVASGERRAPTSSSPCSWKAALTSAVALLGVPLRLPPVFWPFARSISTYFGPW